MAPGEQIWVIDNALSLTLLFNTGCAFGILPGNAVVLSIIAVVSIVLILVASRKLEKSARAARVALGLIMGGALGNLVDRLRFSCVVDFIDFQVWPVFNVADSGVTAGVVLLLWYWLSGLKHEGKPGGTRS